MDHDGAHSRVREGRVPPAAAPHPVRVPVNVHDWQNITFLHWQVPPAALIPLLPDALEVVTHQGSAWVSVTPFFIRVRPPGLPPVPGVTAFPETNVRTYVAGPDGREGLWFLRMEVTRAWFVATLRALGLPYVRRRMSVQAADGRIVYRSASAGRRSHDVAIRPGERLHPSSGGHLARFLTARWGAFHRRGPVLLHTPVEHPPWPLHAAHVERCDVEPLLRSAGLAAPASAPLVHFSPGVTVKVGRPQVVM